MPKPLPNAYIFEQKDMAMTMAMVLAAEEYEFTWQRADPNYVLWVDDAGRDFIDRLGKFLDGVSEVAFGI